MTEELATLIAEARLAGVHPVWLRIISGQQVGFLHRDPSDLRDMLRNQLNRNELHENWRSPPTFHKD